MLLLSNDTDNDSHCRALSQIDETTFGLALTARALIHGEYPSGFVPGDLFTVNNRTSPHSHPQDRW